MRALAVSFVLLTVSRSVVAEADSSPATTVEAMSHEEVQTVRPVKKWYAGATVGPAYLQGWDWDNVGLYYGSIGYHLDIGSYDYDIMVDGNIYAGYRLRSFLDAEVGYSGNNKDLRREYYHRYDSSITVVSRHRIKAETLYVTALYRPIDDGRMYFKLGAHGSRLRITKKLTGTPANLSTIAAGDNYPGNGTFTGFGKLIGMGFDFRTGNAGAIRLEMNRYYGLGGTEFGKIAVNLGYSLYFY
jgi:hypothetical protein